MKRKENEYKRISFHILDRKCLSFVSAFFFCHFIDTFGVFIFLFSSFSSSTVVFTVVIIVTGEVSHKHITFTIDSDWIDFKGKAIGNSTIDHLEYSEMAMNPKQTTEISTEIASDTQAKTINITNTNVSEEDKCNELFYFEFFSIEYD